MNFKKIVAVLCCLNSVLTTQSMGFGMRLVRGAKRYESLLSLAAAAGSYAYYKDEEVKERTAFTEKYFIPFTKTTQEIVALKDGRKIFVNQKPKSLAGEWFGGVAVNSGVQPVGFVQLGRTAFKARAFGVGTHQRNCYEALRDHEVSHIRHDDSGIKYKFMQTAGFFSAGVYNFLRYIKQPIVKSFAGAALGAICYGAGYIATRNRAEKRADLEGCPTSAHAESAAQMFDAIAQDRQDELEGAPITPRLLKAMRVINDKEYEEWVKRFEVVHARAQKQEAERRSQQSFLSRWKDDAKLYCLRHSDIGAAFVALHPHPRVRAQYLREHAEKLRKEGK